MKNQAIIISALIGATQAVKQGTQTQAEGNMGQTITFQEYSLESLDEVQAEIEAWYGDIAAPFIKAHRNQVYKAALAEAEAKYGDLLETCDEGTACREAIMVDLKASMKTTWKRVLEDFKASIKSSITQTQTAVEEVWDKLVQCQIDKPCCQYTEVEWRNNITKIKTKREELRKLVSKWEEFEARKKEIEVECPLNAYPSCPSAEAGTCWDGSDRANDCSCEENTFAACPATPCASGLPRDLYDCSCQRLSLRSPLLSRSPSSLRSPLLMTSSSKKLFPRRKVSIVSRNPRAPAFTDLKSRMCFHQRRGTP